MPKKISREYRVLAIAVVFFATGLFFFLSDHPWAPGATSPTASSTALAGRQIGSVQATQPLVPSLAGDPAPTQFRTFAYASGTIQGGPLTVTSTCADADVAILVFPSGVDYRAVPNRAVYNRAFPCATPGSTMSVTIATADVGNLPSGTYYYFTAAQAADGTWYNLK
jgi:hypothetical protein